MLYTKYLNQMCKQSKKTAMCNSYFITRVSRAKGSGPKHRSGESFSRTGKKMQRQQDRFK